MTQLGRALFRNNYVALDKKRWLSFRGLKHKLLHLLNSLPAIIAWDMLMNLVYIILYATLSPRVNADTNQRQPPSVAVSSIVSIAMDAFLLLLLVFNRAINGKQYPADYTHGKLSLKQIKKKLFNLFQFVFMLFFVAVIISKVIITASNVGYPYFIHDYDSTVFKVSEDVVTVLATFYIASIITECLSIIVFSNKVFIKAKFRPSRVILLISSILQFLLIIAIIQIGINTLINATRKNDNKPIIKMFKRDISLYFHTSAFVFCSSVLGVFISLIDTSDFNRLLKITENFLTFYKLFNLISLILVVTSFILSLAHVKKSYFAETNKVAAPIIFGIIMVTSIISMVSSNYFLKPVKKSSNLKVEVMDLSELTPKQKKAFARLIDYNHKSNTDISGQAAIELMETYAKSTLEGLKCKVLRIYKDIDEQTLQNKKKALPSYETFKAWDGLDDKNLIFDEEYNCLSSIDTLVEDSKPLSKNQLKKLEKKRKESSSKLIQSDENVFPVSEIKNEMDFEVAKTFYYKLLSTEALVLLSVVEDYDLTAAVKGRFGRVLTKLFGKGSISKLLCVKFGLLGFHWPFRRATFYTSITKKPVARSAGVMEAISSWNKALPYYERCSMIIDPIYQNELSAKAIEPAVNWSKVNLPSSHIVDLRPFKNNSLKEYLKKIRYRNKDDKFIEDGGKIIESHDFSEHNTETIISLWKNVAHKRLEDGNTSVLIDPDSRFIQSLNNCNENHDRSLLFLEINNRVLASSVLFRLADTITTDLQGLDYSHGKDYKVYFVMMQRVIEIALKEGRKFVDFGPTTPKPKIDIGCEVVKLQGAITTPNWFLSICVKFAANNVDV